MKAYSWFALKRFTQMIVVIFVGVSVAFLITPSLPGQPRRQHAQQHHGPIELQP